MKIPNDVLLIMNTLAEAGYEAYAVGGCVRDSLLQREPKDWDITTDALPEAVKALFRRTVDTGIEHGTVTVMRGKTGYEVTTYRLDGAYSDGRHPDSVTFTPELREDLRRRDFTINAMACAADGTLVDLFGGQEDLEKRVVRCVGDPDERFTEDALRILRAVRFSAQLDFAIEPETWEALRRHAPNLVHVSREGADPGGAHEDPFVGAPGTAFGTGTGGDPGMASRTVRGMPCGPPGCGSAGRTFHPLDGGLRGERAGDGAGAPEGAEKRPGYHGPGGASHAGGKKAPA